MIDRRLSKDFDHELDDGLKEISDTEIVLNFNNAIVSLYPHLIPVYAHAYDTWDNIVEPLYFQMVYNTFCFKYGFNIKFSDVHHYNYTKKCYRGLHHIECVPRKTSFRTLLNGLGTTIDGKQLTNQIIIFKSFGDGVHFLTGGLDASEAPNVGFHLVEVDIVCKETGNHLKEYNNSTLFVDKMTLNLYLWRKRLQLKVK